MISKASSPRKDLLGTLRWLSGHQVRCWLCRRAALSYPSAWPQRAISYWNFAMAMQGRLPTCLRVVLPCRSVARSCHTRLWKTDETSTSRFVGDRRRRGNQIHAARGAAAQRLIGMPNLLLGELGHGFWYTMTASLCCGR